MLPNPISFIFKLGKHRSLQLRPLKQLSAKTEIPSMPLPASMTIPEASAKSEQAQHSNQMSS